MLFKRLCEHMLLEHEPACENGRPFFMSTVLGLESLLKIRITLLPTLNELAL